MDSNFSIVSKWKRKYFLYLGTSVLRWFFLNKNKMRIFSNFWKIFINTIQIRNVIVSIISGNFRFYFQIWTIRHGSLVVSCFRNVTLIKWVSNRFFFNHWHITVMDIIQIYRVFNLTFFMILFAVWKSFVSIFFLDLKLRIRIMKRRFYLRTFIWNTEIEPFTKLNEDCKIFTSSALDFKNCI